MSLSLLIAVTHLLGVGHLTRAAALARAFARAGHDVTLASGGVPAPLVETGGFRFVQLPPVRTLGTDFRTLLDEHGQPVTPARLEARRDMLLGLVEGAHPDVLLTELFPFGRRALAGEFTALIDHTKATEPRSLILASVRDILVAPARPERVAGTHEILRQFYDAVLVHGDPDLVPLDASWPLDASARALIRYTGYVDDGSSAEADHHQAREDIVVSGGSSAVSLPLYRAAVEAGQILRDHRWRILVGTGVPDSEFHELCRASPANVTTERARSDFRNLLAGAALSVSQAGYNTVVDVLRSRVRAVFIPFEQGGETEQRLRAKRLEQHGLADIIHEADLSAAALAERVRGALQRPHPGSAGIRLDGAERSVALVEELAKSRLRSPGSVARTAPSGWGLLDDALSHVGERGTVVSLWWRDDDALAHTPALDRLLALSHDLNIPVAIAATPARAEVSLGARLAPEPLARVLVHGYSHANHAGAGEKKAEFGRHRPLARLTEDAAEGLRLAKAKFGDRLLPVFVPPWNRLAPELVPVLPELGFTALSAFGTRRVPEPAPGLLQVNAHLDPIDWRGGRGLREPDALLAEFAQTLVSCAEGNEPIGLLTHHLAHDEAMWRFCGELLTRLAAHASVRFPILHQMFSGAHPLAAPACHVDLELS